MSRGLGIASPPLPSAGRWRWQEQWGTRLSENARPSPLVFPFVAQWTPAGTCLVVDRRLPRNRVLEVAPDGEVLWSFEAEPRMNFAHKLDDGTVLLLWSTGLYAVDPDGSCRRRVEFPARTAFSSGSVRGGIFAAARDDGVHLVSLEGAPLCFVPPGESTFVDPTDVQLLPSGNLLVTDATAACVVELGSDGRRERVFGRWRRPGITDGLLSSPYSACRLRDGRTVVADWRSNRLVIYDAEGRPAGVLPAGAGRGQLFGPVFVRETAEGDLLLAEVGHRRVVRRSLDGAVLWEYGPDVLPRRTLAYPRCARPVPDGDGLLVTDSYANRVVELDAGGDERWSFGSADVGLSNPRAATRAVNGRTVVADGLNSRVLVLTPDGRVCRELLAVRIGGDVLPLGDPHQAELTRTGKLFLVDSDLGRVFVVDDDDSVLAQWGEGGQLADPHQARLLHGGGLLIADSANGRVLELDRDGGIRWQLSHTLDPGGVPPLALRYPRSAELMPDDTLVIADSDANRIVRVDRRGRVIWSVGPLLDVGAEPAAAPEIRVPKWVEFDRIGRLLVADHYNSRVVALVRGQPGAQL